MKPDIEVAHWLIVFAAVALLIASYPDRAAIPAAFTVGWSGATLWRIRL